MIVKDINSPKDFTVTVEVGRNDILALDAICEQVLSLRKLNLALIEQFYLPHLEYYENTNRLNPRLMSLCENEYPLLQIRDIMQKLKGLLPDSNL